MILARTLDQEFHRVAKLEDVTMEDLVAEVSQVTNYSPRQIYNFRSGKWPLPAELIPYFCMRFRSRAILDALTGLCNRVPVETPDTYDVAALSTRLIREDLRHWENLLLAYEDGKITQAEVDELETSGQKVIQNICMTLEMVRAARRRQIEARK